MTWTVLVFMVRVPLSVKASETQRFCSLNLAGELYQLPSALSSAPTTAANAREERIAPFLDALGRNLEAAASRISAASCYQKAGDLSRAVNLYQAALAGPLRAVTRKEVEGMLAACLARLKASSPPRKPRRVVSAS